ncbi:oxidoreductase [Segetibacter sp. 3557_3]|uniref:putative oxidoreductase C-terminal domain-containing protein n=1 Tax=Segetibacter sp. 3557_3 TaxID=2547429 RepID=UPI001058415A|nr:putative oxidoreductase C-terminal domain-containing protein [Segetibacter sp. 3557_3]TDH26992.1 oxidoreductase [Segetibacter sp. 3557_3]
MKHLTIFLFSFALTLFSIGQPTSKTVRLITLDPGHFHAALLQKTMYQDVDSVVHVYAPEGNDLKLHLDRINAYNTRAENPTSWKEQVYTGEDFFEKMIAEKKGNVVVLSGNNLKKTEYILKSLQGGLNVLADKPMAINTQNLAMLKQAFETAKKNNVVLYDIMTERFEITTVLQKELSRLTNVFGALQKGTAANPAVTKESVHYFYKNVSGNILTRPFWFMDVSQQGEGIVDVTTHLVDLVQWACFPEQVIDYSKDIQMVAAKRWTTPMRLNQFTAITRAAAFPDYLQKDITSDTVLNVYSNGEINYKLKGVHVKVSVVWNYQAEPGAGDTHNSIMRGTKANLVIRQTAGQQYKPVLYIEPLTNNANFRSALMQQFKAITAKYPGVELKPSKAGWEVVIPDQYKEGHEEHFARVAKKYLEYLRNKNMPAWEVPNMLAKYYTTTKALELAKQQQ